MRRTHLVHLCVAVLALAVLVPVGLRADGPIGQLLAVSRIRYEGNTFGNTTAFPEIFNDPSISGIQGGIFIDYLLVADDHVVRLATLPLNGITTSFSSKSEGALTRSVDGRFLTYMGYDGPVGSQGVSNSYTSPTYAPTGTLGPFFERMVALIDTQGGVSLYPQANAYSGDNPRAVQSVDGTQFYMAGNADSTINKDGTGPGNTIGARYATPVSPTSLELGIYTAADRPDESAKQHVKDRNFRGVGIYSGNLYVSKGSGGNGDDGVFQVHHGSGNGLPTGTGNTITALPGLSRPATDPVTGASSPITPFGFWFANATTLYVADEGYANLDSSGNLIPDPQAGLQKWSLVSGTWQLDYILTDGLGLYQPRHVHGYPVPTFTTGLRNLTGVVNHDGTVTIYAITAQYSTESGGEPDPTRLVVVTDVLNAMHAPTPFAHFVPFGWFPRPADPDDRAGHFETLLSARSGNVLRGVAFAPGAWWDWNVR